METERLCIAVPKGFTKALKVFIVNEQGNIKKGDLSKWVVKSVNKLKKEDKQQQQHTTYDLHGMSKDEEMVYNLTDLMKDITSYFWKLETPFPFRCGVNVTEKALKHAIGDLRGKDSRTPKKWFDRFLAYGFIRKSANREVKILNDGRDCLDIKQEQQEQKKKEFDSTMEKLGVGV